MPDNSGTEKVSGSGAVAPAAPPRRGVSLVIFSPDENDVVRLEPGQTLVMGRSEPADVCIRDRRMSGAHAKFTLREGQVVVEDLGSTNGTWVAGKRIERVAVEPGDQVTLGSTIVHVFDLGMSVAPLLRADDVFRRALDEEIDRARSFRRPFAVLAVRAGAEEAAHAPNGAWAEGLRDHLRAFDRMNGNLFTSEIALVLLPETGIRAALDVAEAIASGAPASGARRIGVATYPDVAATADKLVDLARRAAGRASGAQPVCAAPAGARAESDAVSVGGAVITGAGLSKVLGEATRASDARVPVLIHGETGTGKEVLARFIHEKSRPKGPFVVVNCGALPVTLVESTLFGHWKGAFTGADETRSGAFEDASKGTLFLDEIGELPLAAQPALLRAIEEGSVTPVGTTRGVKVDVRILAATHRDLESMVEDGEFREDLFYRLNTIVLEIPPLRERPDAIEPFARQFLDQANSENNRRVRGFSREAMAALRANPWSGNVRQLRNAVTRAVVMAQGDEIQVDDLPARSRAAPHDEGGHKARRKGFERQALEDALQRSGWDHAEAARRLDMSSRSVRRKIKELGIVSPKAKR